MTSTNTKSRETGSYRCYHTEEQAYEGAVNYIISRWPSGLGGEHLKKSLQGTTGMFLDH